MQYLYLHGFASGPQSAKEWAGRVKNAAGKARAAVESLDGEGRWLSDGRIEAEEFSKKVTAMANYLEAVRKAAE